jgi:hypothetical protein
MLRARRADAPKEEEEELSFSLEHLTFVDLALVHVDRRISFLDLYITGILDGKPGLAGGFVNLHPCTLIQNLPLLGGVRKAMPPAHTISTLQAHSQLFPVTQRKRKGLCKIGHLHVRGSPGRLDI